MVQELFGVVNALGKEMGNQLVKAVDFVQTSNSSSVLEALKHLGVLFSDKFCLFWEKVQGLERELVNVVELVKKVVASHTTMQETVSKLFSLLRG